MFDSLFPVLQNVLSHSGAQEGSATLAGHQRVLPPPAEVGDYTK